MSFSEQQVWKPDCPSISLWVRRMVMPVQSYPSRCISQAATELSTPPLMAMRARGGRGAEFCVVIASPLACSTH